MKNKTIEIREVETVEEIDASLDLQREVFGFNDLEVSPRRYLIVARQSGGFTLGAFDGGKMVGLAITVPAFQGETRVFYSHMAAVSFEYQSYGIGARLKWAQRERALEENVNFIKWTFQPVLARNAFFNLEKLGAVVRRYIPNFYGSGFSNSGVSSTLDSDRVYAEWELDSEKVVALSKNEVLEEKREIIKTVEIPQDWNALLKSDACAAQREQERIKREFQKAFSEGLICRSFRRDENQYLFFNDSLR